MRWWKELRNPALKCARVGHDPVCIERKGYRTAERPFTYVADSCRERRVVCDRCSEALTEWTEHSRSPLSSLSMPDSDWDKLKDKGEVWFGTYPVLEQIT